MKTIIETIKKFFYKPKIIHVSIIINKNRIKCYTNGEFAFNIEKLPGIQTINFNIITEKLLTKNKKNIK